MPAAHFPRRCSMVNESYAAKLDHWQSIVQNIQGTIAEMPWLEAPVADLKQRVEAVRAAHDQVMAMTGKQHEAVVLRRKLSREARKSARRVAAVARGHLGFDNPILDGFGVRSEDPARRAARKPAEPVKPTPQP